MEAEIPSPVEEKKEEVKTARAGKKASQAAEETAAAQEIAEPEAADTSAEFMDEV